MEICVSQRIPGPPEGLAAVLPVEGNGWGPNAVRALHGKECELLRVWGASKIKEHTCIII